MQKITKLCLRLLKLHRKKCGLFFSGHSVVYHFIDEADIRDDNDDDNNYNYRRENVCIIIINIIIIIIITINNSLSSVQYFNAVNLIFL